MYSDCNFLFKYLKLMADVKFWLNDVIKWGFMTAYFSMVQLKRWKCQIL